MMQFIKKNALILLAFLLPISFLFVIAVMLYIPNAFLSTDYNFVYATCDENIPYYDTGCKDYLNKRFTLENNTLIPNEVNQQELDRTNSNRTTTYHARIFLHNTKTNQSKEIPVEEAQNLKLENLLTSPDGVTLENEYSSSPGVFPFYSSGSSYGYYITKGNAKKRMDLVEVSERSYYRDQFKFLGWVL